MEEIIKPLDLIQHAIKKGCKCSNNGKHLQDIQTWLRNKHDIHVQVTIHIWSDRSYKFVIHSPLIYINSVTFLDVQIVGDYNYALEKGIIMALAYVRN